MWCYRPSDHGAAGPARPPHHHPPPPPGRAPPPRHDQGGTRKEAEGLLLHIPDWGHLQRR